MLRCVLATFEEEIAKPKFKAEGKGFTADGSWLMQLMQNLNVTPQSKNEFFEVMDGVIEMRSTHKKAMAIILYNGLTPEIAANCYRVHIYVKFDPKSGGGRAGWNGGRGGGGGPSFSGSSSSSSSSRSSSFFRGRGGGTSSTNRNNFPKKGTGRTLAFWCFSPSVAMSQVLGLGVRSIILTSGTLSWIQLSLSWKQCSTPRTYLNDSFGSAIFLP